MLTIERAHLGDCWTSGLHYYRAEVMLMVLTLNCHGSRRRLSARSVAILRGEPVTYQVFVWCTCGLELLVVVTVEVYFLRNVGEKEPATGTRR